MKLRQRVERLESKRGLNVSIGPSLIYLGSAESGGSVAILIGGGTCSRLEDETESDFKVRVEAQVRTRKFEPRIL